MKLTATVCSASGLRPDPEGYCEGHTSEEIFLAGTEPTEFCQIHKKQKEKIIELVSNLRRSMSSVSFQMERQPLFTGIDAFPTVETTPETDASDNPLLE